MQKGFSFNTFFFFHIQKEEQWMYIFIESSFLPLGVGANSKYVTCLGIQENSAVRYQEKLFL